MPCSWAAAPSAARWLRLAAEAGLAEAQCELARMHLAGDGVAVNDTIAHQWMMRAAEQDHPISQHNLALLYAKGRGVERSLFEHGDLSIHFQDQKNR